MEIQNSREVILRICKMLNIDPNITRKVVMTLEIDSPPIIELEQFVTDEPHEISLAEYELVRKA